MERRLKIVENGQRRAYRGAIEEIRGEIRGKHAGERQKAGPLRRLLLWCRMEWEIRNQAKRRAPNDGLYSKQGRRG